MGSAWLGVVGVCIGGAWVLGGVVAFGASALSAGEDSDSALRAMEVFMVTMESIVEDVPAVVTVVIGEGDVTLAALTDVAMACPIVAYGCWDQPWRLPNRAREREEYDVAVAPVAAYSQPSNWLVV